MASKRKDPTKSTASEVSPDSLPPPPSKRKTSWGKLKLRYLPEERRAKFINPEDEEEYSS